MLSMAIQPSASGAFKPYAFTYPSLKLVAKIPFQNLIFARPNPISFQSPTLSELKFNGGPTKLKLSASSSALAVDSLAVAVAEETPTPTEKLGVVVKTTQKPKLVLKFLWMEKNIGLALDHVIPGHGTIPLSPYYFWPRKDAWEELKVLLESKPWISQKQMIILLNQATDIINLWQQSGGDLL
ncbi:30S ribosomal protein 3, chloroplastic-like isoform X1 [Camellia sinensis]|uniref:Uncharacterized protein n=1 Tax=Camellia sinensis var. sinensis TaxID=542762 RepID=A0A4S4ETF3_CAMSN|nr:30S ribosomal protein 3, chloroplastic-like isoform X1 [Camellia sinensis]THG19724.1 hypothetical protein TEA_028276 [Camellia sinensis var. sinensis]